ncbi:MAG: NAD(P)-dependent oxidoreductase [Planctomycetes bacterium]|nr:NAD(P)-dependent oxidoreductase [Planctomycetota bacterium]
MNVALTGATGFLGRYIVSRLAGAGHRLRCWYRPGSDRSGFNDDASAIDWLPGQLGDDDAMRRLVVGVDAVVHGAVEWQGSRNRGSRSHGDADPFFGVNLTGSLQLFQAAFEARVPRFVHISTCAVHDVILDDRPLDETHPLWPNSHYGAHKAALEAFVHSFGFGQGWPICALRPTGIYGLAHPPRNSRWYDLVSQVLRGERIEAPRGGKEVHAADVARAVELLLRVDSMEIAGRSFNCYDMYVAEEHVARIAKDLTKTASVISSLNRGPKHQIDTSDIRRLGLTFGGDELLRLTVAQLVEVVQNGNRD